MVHVAPDQKTPRAGLDGRPMTRATERQRPRGKARRLGLAGFGRQEAIQTGYIQFQVSIYVLLTHTHTNFKQI